MAEYPTTPKPQIPYELIINWKTIISAFDSGVEQRRQKQTYPKFDVKLTYNALSESNFAILWNFYVTRAGSLGSFYFYTIESTDWDGLFVGTGDAATQVFDIPGKETTNQSIYSNGGLISSEDYTLVVGGGTENADRVIFDSAPTINDIITCDFTGLMRIRCRFKEDKMSKIGFSGAIYQTGLELKGLAAV